MVDRLQEISFDKFTILFGLAISSSILLVLSILIDPFLFPNSGIWSYEALIPIASGLGALGTLTLAWVTFRSLQQNRSTLVEMRKDRRKQVIIDELAEILQPGILRLEDNIRRLETDNLEWDREIHYDETWEIPQNGDSWNPGGSVQIRYAVDFAMVDEATNDRFKERLSALVQSIHDYNELVDVVENKANKVVKVAGPGVANLTAEHHERFRWTSGSAATDNRIVLSLLLDGKKPEDLVGGKDYREFFEKFGDEYYEVFRENIDTELSEFESAKSDLKLESETLLTEFYNKRNTLQQEYGISSTEFQDNIELTETSTRTTYLRKEFSDRY